MNALNKRLYYNQHLPVNPIWWNVLKDCVAPNIFDGIIDSYLENPAKFVEIHFGLVKLEDTE